MSWPFGGSSDEEKHQEKIQEAHNHGQSDGSGDTSSIEIVSTRAVYGVFDGDDVAQAYEAGVDNGRENLSK